MAEHERAVDKVRSNHAGAGACFGAVVAGASASHEKRVTLNIHALREAGYLPQPGKVRQFAEAYRHIKRPILAKAMIHAPSGADPRIVRMASALPGDGKTFTSINLALSMAREKDVSVVLVDGDVVKRDLSRMFGVEKEIGLLDALGNHAIDLERLILPTDVRGLSVMSAGTPHDGATELLASTRMTALAAAMVGRSARRMVILDSPPLLLSSESRALAHIAGQVVMVVCAGKTPRRAILDAISRMERDKPLALVLNLVDLGTTDGYSGYGSYGEERG